ncbi:MAG TPA: proton-conducting transporter membrane subunit [Stellaceae bacterium]|nr:proton-conducting transporter membrane subunit [Stellaceae bacterium]
MFAEQTAIAMLALAIAGAGLCCGLTRSHDVLRAVVMISVVELALAINVWARVLAGNGSVTAADEWIYIDAFSAFHIVALALVFALSSAFAAVYFATEVAEDGFGRASARRFGALWLGAEAAMLLVLMSNNLGIMWVGMEATTLLTAFLISLHPSGLSLEAMWKYLIICSIGIAFAFMGTLLTAASIRSGNAAAQALFWNYVAAPETRLDPTLMKFAFVFVLVGYGTKAGLAPIHSWLPDAHSQAPAPVSAMFSGFLLNTALYCIMRFVPPARHALGSGFASGLLIGFGMLSILVAAGFIVFQRDAKRLLAYHSVEHMGIIALGYGLGPLGAFAALFHTLNHSVCKSLAFFAVGRLGQRFGSHDMHRIAGALRADWLWGTALLISLLALIGVAPFSIFMSEYQLLRAAVGAGAWLPLVLFLAASVVVFVAALRHLIDMAYGTPGTGARLLRDGSLALPIVAVAAGLLLVLGVWMPLPLLDAIGRAAAVVGG